MKNIGRIMRFFVYFFVVLFFCQILAQLFIIMTALASSGFHLHVDQHVAHTLFISDTFMVGLFAIEIGVEIYISRAVFFANRQNLFDFTIFVLSFLVIMYEATASPKDHEVNPVTDEPPSNVILEFMRYAARASRLAVFAIKLSTLLRSGLLDLIDHLPEAVDAHDDAEHVLWSMKSRSTSPAGGD